MSLSPEREHELAEADTDKSTECNVKDNLAALVFIHRVTESTNRIQLLLADGWFCYGDYKGLFFFHPDVTSEKDMCERIERLGVTSDGSVSV